METNRPDYLMGKLMSNELSREELEEFLAGLGETEMSPAYSEILERYFHELLAEAESVTTTPQEK